MIKKSNWFEKKNYFKALRLSTLIWCIPERFPACHLLLRMIGEIKVSWDRFRCVFVVSTSPSCSPNRSPSGVTVSPTYNWLFAKSASYTVDGTGWDTGEMINDLDGSFGSRYFRSVANKRTCFATWAWAFKSWGLLSCLDCTAELKVTYFCRV